MVSATMASEVSETTEAESTIIGPRRRKLSRPYLFISLNHELT
jgi:hypothetical protein